MKSVKMKKIVILFTIILFAIISYVVYRVNFYYIILNEDNAYKYNELLSIKNYIDIYNCDIGVFKQAALDDFESEFIQGIDKYNKSRNDNVIKNPIQAIKIAKEYLYVVYPEGSFKEPAFVTYNKNADAWIIQENVYKFPKNTMGGEFVAVIYAKNGDIIYATHFQ